MYSNSQEQTIYHRLAERIQLGFYDDGQRFPTVQDIAQQFGVSYCPAQRALKALESDGLIQINRGRETCVLRKPYEHYLESPVFAEHLAAIEDLCQSLTFLSPVISFQGLCHMASALFEFAPLQKNNRRQWAEFYRHFEQSLLALGSQSVLSLYYDISAFLGSTFLDIAQALFTEAEEKHFLEQLAEVYHHVCKAIQNGQFSLAKQQLEKLSQAFSAPFDQRLRQLIAGAALPPQKNFHWAPHKGRKRYRDLIALDLARKINQGLYPVGTLLPHGPALADIYHVSSITIRRTIELLNQLGFTKTVNGIGTYVVHTENSSIPSKLKDLNLDESLYVFLEALQLLTITCEAVCLVTFPHFTPQSRQAIVQAAAQNEDGPSIITAISACMQAIVHDAPFQAVQEIYRNLTLMLLNGNVLPLSAFAKEPLDSWPQLAGWLTQSLSSDNSQRFALAFRQLSLSCFQATKSYLLSIGMSRIEAIATPVFYD